LQIFNENKSPTTTTKKRTTFVSKEGEAIYDPMTIAKNYLRGWFIIDAFSAMPYDLILFGSGSIEVDEEIKRR
jgi:hypothetical protein